MKLWMRLLDPEICKHFSKIFSPYLTAADDGISGTHENRKDYIELKKLVKCGEINLVIITDTDRIGRNTSINTSFAKLLISKGA